MWHFQIYNNNIQQYFVQKLNILSLEFVFEKQTEIIISPFISLNNVNVV